MILDKYIGNSTYDMNKVLLVHRVEEGEYEETQVSESSYLCENEREAAERIRVAAFSFCHDIRNCIDSDTEFSINYRYTSAYRRSLFIEYKKNDTLFKEELYITNPKT